MKTRALLHLMLAAARSARDLVGPESRAKIDDRVGSLAVDRAGRGAMELSWTAAGDESRLVIDSTRFSFYVRGDVPALVKRRQPGTDLRGDNWTEAHRLWAEIIGDESLAAVEPPPRRFGPPTSAPVARGQVIAGPAAALAGMIVALTSESDLGVAIALALVAAALTRRSVLWALAGSIPVSLVAVNGADIGSNEIAGVVAGIGLVAAATMLIPHPSTTGAIRLLTLGSALGAVVLAAPGAGWWFRLTAAALLTTDGFALTVRSEGRRLMSLGLGVAVTVAAWPALDSHIGWPARPWDSESPTWLMVSAAICFGAIAVLVVWSFFFGVRDRLSTWLAPIGLAVAGFGQLDATVTGVWAGVVLAVVGLDALGDSLRRRAGRSAPPVTTTAGESQGLVIRTPRTPLTVSDAGVL